MSTQPVYSHVATHDEIPLVEGVEVPNSSTTSSTASKATIESSNNYVGQVVAPATLPEGYEIPVTLGSSQFNVRIPNGGQVFNVSIPQPIESSSTNRTLSTVPPEGYWRDDICGCCSHGVFHPHCLTAWCCPLCTLL